MKRIKLSKEELEDYHLAAIAKEREKKNGKYLSLKEAKKISGV